MGKDRTNIVTMAESAPTSTTDIRAPERVETIKPTTRVQAKTTVDPRAVSNTLASYFQRRQKYAAMKRRERMAAQAAAGTLKPPRKLVYFSFIALAILADIVGIGAQFANLTGVLAILVSVISFFVGIFFFIVSYFLGKNIAATRDVGNEFSSKIGTLERRISLLQDNAVRLASAVRRSTRDKSSLRTTWKRKLFVGATRKISTWSRFASRYLKYAQVILESIPFINILPWYTINMVLIYRERQKEYEAALESVAQYVPVDLQEDSAFANLEAVDADRIQSLTFVSR